MRLWGDGVKVLLPPPWLTALPWELAGLLHQVLTVICPNIEHL